MGPGTCTVSLATTVTGTALNRPYEAAFVGTMPQVVVTVTGGTGKAKKRGEEGEQVLGV